MNFYKLCFSFILLIIYGGIVLLSFNQININDFSISDNQLKSEYEYIVIGAGSAGSVIASRLAQHGLEVLLLEAGGSDYLPQVRMPMEQGAFFGLPEMMPLLWEHTTTFEKENYKKEIDMRKGKIVGGSGSINGCVWNKGNKKIYDRWELLGAKGWNSEEVDKYYEKAEQTLWITQGFRYLHQAMRDLIPEAGKLIGFTEINEKQEGFGVYDTNIRNGRRWTAADAYLKPTLTRFPDKLQIKLNATVDKILFNKDNTQAVGVVLENKKVIKVKNEIILSAGAFGSPAILMRSGVGNASELKRFGIISAKNLTGVGENMQEHPVASFILRTNETKWDSIKPTPPSFSKLIDYYIFGNGELSSNVASVGGYIKTKYARFEDVEDVQFHCASLFLGPSELYIDKAKDNRTEDYITCLINLATPRDKGSVKLKSLDINDPLEIKVNFLEFEEDIKAMMEGYRIVREFFKSPTFNGKAFQYMPSEEEFENQEKLRKFIYKSLFTIYHPTGTCKIGDIEKDEKAVVDYKLRVRGFSNLRVIDASVMPEITNSNTNAPTIMIAEKGASMIIDELGYKEK